MGGEQTKDKRQTNIQNLFLPLKNSNKIDNKLFDVTKQIVMRLHKGEYYLITEYFKNKETSTKIRNDKQKYLCEKDILKDEVFYLCKTCSYLKEGASYCQDCFVKQKHLNHDYVPLNNQAQMCYCGYDHLADQKSFCKSHLKYKKQTVPLDAKIKKQLKLYIQLLLLLKQQAKYFQLQPHIFQYYGEPLFQYLLYLAKGDIAYCRVIALIFLQTADILTNLQIEIKIIGKNLLENLIIVASQSKILANFLTKIINELFQVGEISRGLLRIYYNVLLSGDEKNCINNILCKLQFDVPLCFKNQMEYFSNPQNCRLSICNLSNEISQQSFYQAIEKILTFKNHEIINKILNKTRVSEMFNFQRLSFEIVQKSIQLSSKTSMKCFEYIYKILNIVNDKNILKDLIKDSLQYILKNKIPTFSLFFQRVFALAVYKYYDFKISNMGSLLSTLQSFYPQVAQEKCNILVKFLSVRDYFHDQYEEKIKKTIFFQGLFSLKILANDQLYLKIITNLLKNKEEVIQFYRSFIARRIFNGVSQQQFYQKKLTTSQVLKQTIKKTKTFFTSLSNSIVHNADQFIIQGNNGNEKSIQSILSYLAQIFQGSNASQFKKNAQNIVSPSKVVKFIKEKIILQGKKIHYKSQGENIIILSPCSQLFSSKLPEIIFQRMITLFCKSQNPNKSTIYAEEQSLQMWTQLLHKCIYFIQENGEVDAQIKLWLKNIVDSFLALGLQNKSESFMQLMNRMQRQINNSPLNLYGNNYKPIIEAIKNEQPVKETAQNMRNNKKKLKLQNIREKQKQMLEIHHMEEQKRTAECIVCKNSRAGNPFLLGHFGYKNIFCRVLQAQTPFLQFSSCGHYIHEDCLQQSHKGEFKIWYPCILCKSICNILLPNVSNVNEHGQAENQQEQLQRIIIFLKNLGGIYTFFYQDRKQLIEFGLQNVENVFPLLFKTLVYQITFYPILNLQYFQRSQLPVTKFLYDLLVFTTQKLKSIELFKKIALKGHPFFVSLYQYVSDRLRYFLQHKSGHMQIQNNIPKDITNLVEEITYFLQGKSQNIEHISASTKEYRQIVVQGFIKPPKDLTKLQENGQICASCQKSTNNYQLCLLCGWLCCSKCTQVKKVHALEVHLSESVFLRNANGKYIYVHQQLQGEYDSLYVDYLGQEYGGVSKPNFGDYQISKERWEILIEDLLNNRLHREIMKVQ